ncbi:MAG: hypothetical protein CMH54_13380 [Myxococcales bacterium]|nr:hypothetical protein [Myxococcales bacterium]
MRSLSLKGRGLATILALFLTMSAGCSSDSCKALLDTVCSKRPSPELCARYTKRLKKDSRSMSDAMCRRTEAVYRKSLKKKKPTKGKR